MIRYYLTLSYRIAFLLAAICFMAGAMSVHAKQVSLEQKQALVQKIEAINQGLDARDIRPLVEALPPRFYQEMAVRLQRDIKDLQEDFTSSLQQQFDGDGMNDYRFDAQTISYHETKTGEFYALVPTRVEMQDNIHLFQTLAIYENGWYLVQGGQKTVQNPAFLEIYPFLAEIRIPPAQTTKIENQK